MRLKSIISWALIFSFTFLLCQPLLEAKEIEKQYVQAKIAELSTKYSNIHQDMSDYKDKVKNNKSVLVGNANAKSDIDDLMLEPSEFAEETDEYTSAETTNDNTSADTTEDSSMTNGYDNIDPLAGVDTTQLKEAAVAINVPEKAYAGDDIQITVAVVIRDDIAVKIDKIDLLVSDPKTDKDYFKDQFVNYKDQTKILFTYNWDTYAAGTNPGSHTVTVKVYPKENSDSELADVIIELKKPVTATMNILADPGIDIYKHGFWGGYLRQDGSLNTFWQKKLGCSDTESCKTRDQIREHLATAIQDGDFSVNEEGRYAINSTFNKAEEAELDSSFNRYMHSLEISPPADEESKITASTNALTMSDFINLVQDNFNSKLGIDPPQLSEATMTAPELYTAMKVYNEYSVKIASYAPESLDELKSAPFWGDMEKKISENISKDEEDQIENFEELDADYIASIKSSSLAGNLLRPQKADAWFWIAAGIVFIVYDIYKLTRPGGAKDWKNWGLLALDILLLPIGGASLAEKALVHVGSWLGRVLKIEKATQGIAKWWKVTRASKWVSGVWKGVTKWKGWDNPIAKKIVEGIGKWASDAWVALRGWNKKGLAFIRGLLRLGLQASLHNNGVSECKGLIFMVKNGLDPFAWALCNITKFVYDLASAIHRFAFCLMRNSIADSNSTKACEFKLGP